MPKVNKISALFDRAVEDHIKTLEFIAISTIKKEIRGELSQMTQWDGFDDAPTRAKYYYRLESLVELLEVRNCGSVGGFDSEQTGRFYSLRQRAEFVLNKGE